MKRLIAALLILSNASFVRSAEIAAQTLVIDTTAVENRVVEIHMTSKVAEEVSQSKTKRHKKIEVMPLPGQGTCSGFFIDGLGDILTARHCVEGFDAFQVVTFDQREYKAVVVAVSDRHDLAMIHIDRIGTNYFNAAETVTRGETIFVLGSPLGITNTLSTGIIAKLDGDLTLVDCSVLPGNSGGPVFDSDGNLIGVVSAGFVVGSGMTHLNILQSLDAVRFFMHDVYAKFSRGR